MGAWKEDMGLVEVTDYRVRKHKYVYIAWKPACLHFGILLTSPILIWLQ